MYVCWYLQIRKGAHRIDTVAVVITSHDDHDRKYSMTSEYRTVRTDPKELQPTADQHAVFEVEHLKWTV
jgi:hypothetical protein